jgi:Lon-like protease
LRYGLTPLKIAGLVGGFLLVVLIVLVRVPSGGFPGTSGKYVLLPDVAHPVGPLVHVHGAHPAKGGVLYFVDVIERKANTLEELFPSIDSHATFVPESEIVPPGSTSAAVVQAELRQMSMSQRIAAAVAERQLGYHVVIHRDGVLVNFVYTNTNAEGKVEAADVIVGVDGTPTPTKAKLRARLRSVQPGQTVTLKIRRGAKTLTVRVRTVDDPRDPGRAIIGFNPAQSFTINKLPIPVTIRSGGVGGPSAGLAFTLDVLQQLGHDVTHGYNVAATGEMQLDGRVTAIGGVEQKTWGVREAKADVFLVPVDEGNAKEAEKFAGPNLKIIPVTSLKQALHALATLPPKR